MILLLLYRLCRCKVNIPPFSFQLSFLREYNFYLLSIFKIFHSNLPYFIAIYIQQSGRLNIWVVERYMSNELDALQGMVPVF